MKPYDRQQLRKWLHISGGLTMNKVLTAMRKQMGEDDFWTIEEFVDGWRASIIWAHHDGDIPEFVGPTLSRPSLSVYRVAYMYMANKLKVWPKADEDTVSIFR